MLVLRRRAEEVIVFEGGLSLTVLEVGDRRAWLGFEAPSIDGILAMAVTEVGADHAVIAVRSPAGLSGERGSWKVTVSSATYESGGPTLLLPMHTGDRIELEGLAVTLGAVQSGRATLGLDVACLSDPVSVTVQSTTGSEARIGIEAPENLRVYRKELWVELLGANQAAATWSEGDLEGLLPKQPQHP